MKLSFLGAAGTVTGSKYLLETKKGRYFLVDCGLFQGLKDLRMRNWQDFPIDPSLIEAVFITHAHIDHSGYLPRLFKLGFNGPVYCSKATAKLLAILLPDSGYLQEEEAFYANKKGYTKHKPALALYTRKDAEDSLSLLEPVDFHKTIKIKDDIQLSFIRAGHILGASSIIFEAEGKKIAFSGDVGRFKDLIMRAPEPLPEIDYLVIESTYGNTKHIEEDVDNRFAQIINETQKKHGVILIPAFAIGRAQHMLYIIHRLKKAKKIVDLPVYLDSPMAINATELYCEFNKEHRLSDKDCELMCTDAILTKTVEESKAIASVKGPKIIISASGMASGGRVVHHLSQLVSDPNNTIVLVGFQAAGTRGRALLEGVDQIKMFGEYFNVNAKIENIPALSAHADYQELIDWLKMSSINPHKVFITHGEKASAEAFCVRLKNIFHWQASVAHDGMRVEL